MLSTILRSPIGGGVMIPVEPLISKSAGPIFAKFSGFVELWLQMISLCVLDTLVNPTKRMNGLTCLLSCSHWNHMLSARSDPHTERDIYGGGFRPLKRIVKHRMYVRLSWAQS